MKVFFAIILISLVVLVSCNKHHSTHHDNKKGDKSKNGDACHFYQNGLEYNYKYLNNEIQIQDSTSATITILFNPCGPVNDGDCPPNTSVCLKIKEGTGINYGSSQSLLFNSVLPTDNVSSIVEGMYGNGEQCNNGVPRKTIVEYVCDVTASDSQDITSVEYDTCSMNLRIESPLACPLDVYCNSKSDADSCQKISGICIWDYKSNSCESITSSYAGAHYSTVISIFILGVIVLVLIGCSLCLCCVAFKKRRNRRRLQRRAALASSKKTIKRKSKSSRKKKQQPASDVQYQPLPQGMQHIQLVPGNFAPMSGTYEVPIGHFPLYPIVVKSVNTEIV